MFDPFQRYRPIYAGLRSLLGETQSYTQQIPQKLAGMQEVYLHRNPQLYDSVQVRKLRYYQAAFAYKDLLVAYRLEALWSIVHAGSGDRLLPEVLANIYDEHDTSNEHIVLLSFALDDLLLQATAFLDFYMLYLRAFFRLSDTGKLSPHKLMQALEDVDEPAPGQKASNVREFFRKRVFAEPELRAASIVGWGKLLRSLRNSVIHRDTIYPAFDTGEKLVEKITHDWPEELHGINAVRFAQYIQNDMFTMIRSLASMLYDLEWKSGPYRPDLWGA